MRQTPHHPQRVRIHEGAVYAVLLLGVNVGLLAYSAVFVVPYLKSNLRPECTQSYLAVAIVKSSA